MRNIESLSIKNLINIDGESFEFNENGFVDFGEMARKLLNQQSQYASRYIDGALKDYPNLGQGLNFEGDASNYHEIKIHKDSILEFVKRVREYKEK